MIRVPGDKSVSHRALLFSALAVGESRVSGLLPGADCRSTAEALRAMGVRIPTLPADGREFRIPGVGLRGLGSPAPGPLDCGNSGTTARLLLGLLAGCGVEAVLTGDRSLRSRPMRRITTPLREMGARFAEEGEDDRLPVRVLSAVQRGIEYRSPVASAQVKSALLLAGLAAGVPVTVTEPGRSRDHTERMLRRCGVPVEEGPTEDGWRVHLSRPPDPQGWVLSPLQMEVPGDLSSAVFPIAFALLGGVRRGGEEGPLNLDRVGMNPTRTGILPVLARMGAEIRVEGARAFGDLAGEPTANLRVAPCALRATRVEADEVPLLIDEVPILAALAARAEGRTVIRGAGELRVKESDRIHALVSNLRRLGVSVEEFPDGLAVTGSDAPLRGRVEAFHDHRVAMAFGVLGALPGNRIDVEDPSLVEVSYPGFWDQLASLAGRGTGERQARGAGPGHGERAAPVITIDGPAGSGKSTTARAVAEALGFQHLDSGALFRAVTLALVRSGLPEEEWDGISPEALEDMGITLRPEGPRFRILIGGREAGAELRGADVTERVPVVARIAAVRAWLQAMQRRAAGAGGLVVDGRDTGSVVFPDADVKVFLTASLPERARRRLLQEGREATPASIAHEAARLRQRDAQDADREIAPLCRPVGALDVDTTGLSFEAQVARIVAAARGER